jgi:hypothetical protein
VPPADTAIFLLGAQRSGTTWLGKIFDSHPDVLYRHEPDHGDTSQAPLRTLVENWIANRSQRAAAKRPFFRKSWQSAPAFWARSALATLLAAATRLPAIGRTIARLSIPDLGSSPHMRVAIKSIDWCEGVGAFARVLPDSRTIVILRHPCGQVASVMRGNAGGRFTLREPGTDMPFDEIPTLRFAAARGVDEAAFQALPEAARYAWAWVMFNETALNALEGLPNAKIVVYEDLCARPAETARDMFSFAGLDWNSQTVEFLERSTNHQGTTGYYAVFKNAIAAAERWRATMPPADQDAVREVVCQSPLARFWPDLQGDPVTHL